MKRFKYLFSDFFMINGLKLYKQAYFSRLINAFGEIIAILLFLLLGFKLIGGWQSIIVPFIYVFGEISILDYTYWYYFKSEPGAQDK